MDLGEFLCAEQCAYLKMFGFIRNIYTRTLKRTINWLRPKSRPVQTAVGIAFVALVAVFDFFTGYEANLSACYLGPIFLVTWTGGRVPGFIVSIASALAEMIANTTTGRIYSRPALYVWNVVIQSAIFITMDVILINLKEALAREHSLARTDTVTGLPNKKAFYERIELEIERCRRFGHPLTLAYFDCDNFKNVNDSMGHHAGDRLLHAIGAELTATLRVTDYAARLGGDEFAILLGESGLDTAEEVLSRLQTRLRSRMNAEKWPVSFSIGAISCSEPPDSADHVVGEADRQMYDVKTAGKNGLNIRPLKPHTIKTVEGISK